MRRSVKIADTTREERIAIVVEGLSWCGDSSCDSCSGCTMGIDAIDEMYLPYIEGELELAEVNHRAAATRYVHG